MDLEAKSVLSEGIRGSIKSGVRDILSCGGITAQRFDNLRQLWADLRSRDRGANVAHRGRSLSLRPLRIGYQLAQLVLEGSRGLRDFDKLPRIRVGYGRPALAQGTYPSRSISGQEQWLIWRVLQISHYSKPLAKFIAKSTFFITQLRDSIDVAITQEGGNPIYGFYVLAPILAVANQVQTDALLHARYVATDLEGMLVRSLELSEDGYYVVFALCVELWLASFRASRLKAAGLPSLLLRQLGEARLDDIERDMAIRLLTVVVEQPAFKLHRKRVTAQFVFCGWKGCLRRDDTESPSFKMCKRCELERYCSIACQTSHWKNGHKKACKQTAE